MFRLNQHPDHGMPLESVDAETLGLGSATEVERYLGQRHGHVETPLHHLPTLAAELGLGEIHMKDEGHRFGLGSFKALGGAYAVARLLLEDAGVRLGRHVGIEDLHSTEVQSIAATMTVACATDGNHGRSVAQGAELVGCQSVIFVHAGVSERRVVAIARFGARVVQVEGTYDDAVADAARVAARNRWTIVSDTSWPGYERIPGLVMQGYTALVGETLRALPQPPTHVFVQAGVGGLAAAVAGHLAIVLGDRRPVFVVVEPARAACLMETAKVGHPVKIAHGEPTVMAMLECYKPSLVAWRVLARAADAFMMVDEEDAIAAMNRLARPAGDDPSIVAGESGGVGLAGLLRCATDPVLRSVLGLDASSRVFVINTEGATDPHRYAELVGLAPAYVAADRHR